MERKLRELFVEDEVGAFREHDIVSTFDFNPTIDPFELCEPSTMGAEVRRINGHEQSLLWQYWIVAN